MPKILITGATGYLGSTIASYFFTMKYNFSVLVRKESSLERLKGLEGINFLYFEDLYSSPEQKFELIIHCATLYKSKKQFDLVSSNITFPLSLIEKLLLKNGIFINIDTSLNPETNLYSSTKNNFENILKSVASEDTFKVLNLELEYFFNEFEPQNRFLTSLIKACVQNDSFSLTEGDQIRDFIYLEDVCSAIQSIIENLGTMNESYKNIPVGSGLGISIKDLAYLIKKLSNSKSELKFGEIPYRETETMYSQADTDFLKNLGWSLETSLETGLKKTIQKLRSENVY